MIDELKALRAVIQHRSLTGAAAALHLTQSAISRRIQQLEETLGGDLLDRTSRPPTPTPLGNRIYERSQSILVAIDQLLLLASENAAPAGILRIGVTHAISDAVIAATAGRLTAAFPLLDLRLRTAWSPSLTDLISNGALDAAVILLPSGGRPSPAVDGERIASLEVVIVQSKAHPTFAGKVRMSELADQRWILNPQGCGYRAEIERAIGLVGKNLRVMIDTYGMDIQLRMIASGMGIGVIPKKLLLASPARDELAIVNVQDFSVTLDMWVVHPSELGNLKSAVELFVAAIAADITTPKPTSITKSRPRSSPRKVSRSRSGKVR
mgnify:CR=1 FL=1